MWLNILLLFLILSTSLLILIGNARKENRPRWPPCPPKLPFIGNLHQLGSLPHRSLWRLSRTYGPVMLLRHGGVMSVVISSTEAAKEALKVNDLHCCSRPPLLALRKLSYDSSDINFSPYSEHWREMRKIYVLKLFSLKNVQSFRVVKEEEIGSLIGFLKKTSSSPVDVGVKMVGLTTRMIFRIAFGTSFDQSGLDDAGVKEMVDWASSLFGSFMASDFFPSVGWIVDRLTGQHAKLDKSFCEMDALYERVIDEHLSGTVQKGHEDIVGLLLRVEREQSESRYDQVPFTRACVKAFIMPKVMKKAQAEVRSCSRRGDFVTESELPNLKYLKMVLKETLRLHPPAPLLLPRETMSQFSLNGFEIYPKTMLQVNTWAIGRDPEYWANAEEFSPERFVDGCVDYKGHKKSALILVDGCVDYKVYSRESFVRF